MSEHRTYKGWQAIGFHVRKGQKAERFDENGDALFSIEQASPPSYSSGDDYEYEGSEEEMLGSWDWYK